MPDEFPLVSRRSQHVSEPLATLLRREGLTVKPPLEPGWPPLGWKCDTFPRDDSDEAIAQWYDCSIYEATLREAASQLPRMVAGSPDMPFDSPDAAGRIVRHAYRLLRHLRDRGRTQAEDDEQPGWTYTMHDAQIILRRLRDGLFPGKATPDVGMKTGVPWEGDDFDELEPLPRRLLLYMHQQERADLADLCDKVWGKDYADVSESAIHTAVSKANSFLLKMQWPRQLHKPRGETEVRWE